MANELSFLDALLRSDPGQTTVVIRCDSSKTPDIVVELMRGDEVQHTFICPTAIGGLEFLHLYARDMIEDEV